MDTVFENWIVEKCIGEGAFGKVYRIIRKDFGHTYESALKVIEIPQNQAEVDAIRNDGMTEQNVTEYFQSMVEDIVDEFALMSKLKGNSNIVSYEDHEVVRRKDAFGWDIYIRMELLTPLFKHIKEHEITVRDVIQIGIDICNALEVCQKYNIIHRDIKPENIFVSDVGTYKLGDFGIARQLEKTSSGLSKKGTYTYMAPEVYKGLEYNSTVDIYSLGIVLYRFLNNNRSPFMPPLPMPIKYSDKEKANLLRMSGQRIPKPCNASGRLAEIVLKACAYNPSERYESASAMKRALQEILYTDSERKLIYPSGDTLENKKAEYVLDNIQNSSKMNEKIHSEDNHQEGTVYLFKEEKAFRKEEEASQNKSNTVADSSKERGSDIADTIESKNNVNSKILERQGVEKRDITDTSRLRSNTSGRSAERQNYKEKVTGEKEKEVAQSSQNSKTEKGSYGKKKKYLRVFLILALVVSIGITITLIPPSEKRKEVVLTDLTGMTVEQAEQLLEEDNLILQIASEKYSNFFEEGLIISQNYKAGESVKEGTAVEVVVSRGQEEIMPEIGVE